MKAAQFSRFGGPEVLEIVELPDPHAGPGQIRIRVRAAGINATEWKLRKGLLNFGATLPQTTGRDVAGIVDEIGEEVTDVALGDRVFGGLRRRRRRGRTAAADLSRADPAVARLRRCRRPARRARNGDAQPRPARRRQWNDPAHQRRAGGIGSTAVQLAVARGAHVIGTASTANHDYLRLLGTEPVTYGDGMVGRVRALAPAGVDLALDVAGSGVLPELIELPGGPENVVTLADFDGAKQHEVRFSNGFNGHAFHALAEIGTLIAAGRFWLPVERTYPLAEIAAAHRVSETGHVRGRLVLVIG